jgi:DNA/RNA endonuclease YhcR with UshA esterase domain
MSATVHFGSNTTEFPLAGAPEVFGSVVSFAITPSITVTAEAVAAALKGAVSYTVTTDGTAGAVQDNFVQSGNVAIDSGTGNIVFAMRQKSEQEITINDLQTQVAALGQQVVALSLGGAAS